MAFVADGNATPPTALSGTPQTLTASWADLGGEIEIYRKKHLGLWLQVDINLSNNLRVMFLAKTESGGTLEYSIPIETISATDVKINAEYKELNTDADQNIVINWDLPGYIPVGQFQVMVGTLGATAAIITSAFWSAAS